MKKKIAVALSLMLCLMLSISLAACSKNKHEAKSEWKFDNVQHWHECATKGHDDKLDVAAHTWNDGEVATDPTETTEGVKTYTCTVCSATKTESMPKLNHTHTFDTGAWEKDGNKHWHKATCGHDVKKDEADHTWNDGVITKEPTETAEGVKTFTCTVCRATKTESVPKLTHTHTFDTANWETSDTYHWHKATCAHTDEISDKAEHTLGNWTTKTPADYGVAGEEKAVCTVCGYEKKRPIEALQAKDNTITVGTIDFTYNANSQPIDSLVTAGNKEGMVVKYVGVDGTEYAESTTAPTNAGTYQYTVTIPATAEWKAAEISDKYTINKYELTEVYGKTHTKEYSGTLGLTVKVNPFDNEEVSVNIAMKKADAGTKEIGRVWVVGVTNSNNYTIDQSKVKAEILPKKLSDLKLTIQESDIDKEQVVVKFTMEIDGVNKEKVSVILEFYWEDLDNEEELQLTPDLPEKLGTGKCKITLKDAANYELNGNIGTLTLVR